MSDPALPMLQDLTSDEAFEVERVCTRFEIDWQQGKRPLVEEQLSGFTGKVLSVLVAQLVGLELDYRRLAGEQPTSAEYLHRFPAYASFIVPLFGKDIGSNSQLIHTTSLLAMLTRYREGDTSALNELLLRIHGRLAGWTRKMLRSYPVVKDNEQTDDVLQNALLRLTRALQAVQPTSSGEFFGLAAELIRRELIDLARYYRRRAGINQRLPVAVGAKVDPGDPCQQASQDLDRWTAFHEAIDGLPTEQRQVFSLTFYNGLSQAEIARALGVSDRQVRRLWRAACMRLNEDLKGNLPLARRVSEG